MRTRTSASTRISSTAGSPTIWVCARSTRSWKWRVARHAFMHAIGRELPRHLVVISVNASTDPEPKMDLSNKQPSLEETIGAVSSAQLHRYNAATLELMNKTLPRWARNCRPRSRPSSRTFIQMGFNDIDKPDLLQYFNLIPTSFDLTTSRWTKLIAAGRQLIRSNPDFQKPSGPEPGCAGTMISGGKPSHRFGAKWPKSCRAWGTKMAPCCPPASKSPSRPRWR